MYVKMLLSLLLCGLIFYVVWCLRGKALSPVKLGKNQHLSLVLTVSGRSEELEYTVQSLRWLISGGTLDAELIVRDAGMDPETAEIAARLGKKGAVKIIY